ncbi:hypothetical protein [Tepidiforma thermophila]|uniref:Uncharacterized protein n=1 Tax=Tepidiforma thermophila (strain KCTC 52669 / CGMCC 1.13589 / G233) TaxID=2761530 RepID=A0A2A9HCD4_TEPT2|nr:hypothetical protein [Tepidiforma thermophila]PFG73667.1 hypothetical protein A9A59_0869 [Tepidiforma thermophila]
MGALADLGLSTSDGPIMLVSAPDSVLAEASRMKPRPAFASSILTAEPTPRILWWPERAQLEPGLLSRLAWMTSVARGEAWLILDPAEPESPAPSELEPLLPAASLALVEQRPIGRGEIALRVRPRGA